jgi:hypothetical protein
MSELEEARERYRKHLARKQDKDSPYHTSYGKSFLAGTWRDDLIADDEALLARSACDGDGERGQFLKQLLREARIHWYHDLDVPSAAALELKLVVDAAIDAARKGVRG